jgi:hypothetical protein
MEIFTFNSYIHYICMILPFLPACSIILNYIINLKLLTCYIQHKPYWDVNIFISAAYVLLFV